jgi:outer membrane protein assembly factor BamE (lipoprotein component of BamABCDE complex)
MKARLVRSIVWLRRPALAAFALWMGIGCISVGNDFPVEPVRQIEIGTTTRDDVQRMFGDPWRTGIEDGQRTWTYGTYRYSLFGDASTRDLVVRFDDEGAVSSYTFNSTRPEDAAL